MTCFLTLGNSKATECYLYISTYTIVDSYLCYIGESQLHENNNLS